MALVSNVDRYLEVSEAAANSEDAGLLQYSKTLDSLETKLNNISTSFQQFYMSILNGPFFGSVLDFVNNLIKGLNKLGNFSSIFNVLGIVRSVKTVSATMVNTFSNQTNTLRSNIKSIFAQITSDIVAAYRKAGVEGGQVHVQALNAALRGQSPGSPAPQPAQTGAGKLGKITNALSLGGALASTIGVGVASNNALAGGILTTAGSALSYGAQGAMMGAAIGQPIAGAIIGGIVGVFSQVPGLINAYANQAQEALDKAKEEAKEKNLERAEAAERARNLEAAIDNLKKLQKARYDSEEAEKAFVDAQNEAYEQFPELASGFTATGDAIVDVISNAESAEMLLIQARQKAAKAANEAAAAELGTVVAEKNKTQEDLKNATSNIINAQEPYGRTFTDPIDIALNTLQRGAKGSNSSIVVKNQNELAKRLKESNLFSGLSAEQILTNQNFWETLISEQRLAKKGTSSLTYDNQYQALANSGLISQMNAALPQEKRIQSENWASYSQEEVQQIYEAYQLHIQGLYRDLSIEENAEIASQKANLGTEFNQLIENAYSDFVSNTNKSFLNLIQSSFIESIEDPSKYFDAEGKIIPGDFATESSTYIQAVQSFWKNLENSYNTDEFLKYIEQFETGKLAYNDIQNFAKSYQDIPEELLNNLVNNLEKNKTRLVNKLKQDWNIPEQKISSELSFLDEIPQEFYNKIADFSTNIKTKIENEKIPAEIGENIYQSYKELLQSIEILPEELQNQAYSIISSGDLTTTLGKIEIQQKLDEAGISLNVKNFPTYAENLVTQYGSLTEELATGLQNLSKALEQAASGFEYEDAVKVANQLGKAVLDVFDFSDGKYFIKDIEDLNELYTKESQEKTAALNDELDEQIALLNQVTHGAYFQSEFEEANALVEQYLAPAQEWYKESNEEAYIGDAIELIKNYIGHIRDSATEAIKQEETYLFAKADAAEIAAGTSEMKADDFIKKYGEAYRYLLDQAQWSFEKAIDSFTQGAYSLGKEIASKGSEASSKDLYDWLTSSGIEIDQSKLTEDFITGLMFSLMSGDVEALRDKLKEAGAKNITEGNTEAIMDNFTSGYYAQLAESGKTLVSNYLQVMQGELDPSTIEDSELKAELTQFASNVNSQLSNYISKVLEVYEGNFEEQVSQISKGYETEFKKYFPETSLAKTLAESSRLSNDDYIKVLSTMSALTGTDVGFFDYADYNSKDQSWILNTDKIKAQLTTIANEYDTGVQQILARRALVQLEYLEGWQTEAQKTETYSTLEEFSTLEEITADNIRKLYESYGQIIDADKAAAMAADLQELDPLDRMEEIKNTILLLGGDLDETKYKELVSTVFDAILSSIENGLSSLSAGIEGTLDFSTYNDLVKKYGLSGMGRMTSTGVQLEAGEQRKLIGELYKEAERSGMAQGFGDKLWNTLKESQQSSLKGYRDIEEELANIHDTTSGLVDEQSKLTEEAYGYAAALQQARVAAIMDENSYEFSFMDQEVIGGMTKNFDNFLNQIDSVKNAFSSFEAGESIDYASFLNMFDFLNEFDTSFGDRFTQIGDDYEAFIRSVIANSKEIGKIDIGAVAGQLGIDVETAMSTMSESMEGGLKEVAQQQVKYLDGLISMLEAMQALEDVGNIETELGVKFSFTTSDDEPITVTVENLTELFDKYKEIPEKDQKNFLVNFKTHIDDNGDPSQKALMNMFLGEDGALTEQGIFAMDYFAEKQVNFKNLSEQQSMSLATLLSTFNPENFGSGWAEEFESQLDSVLGTVGSVIDEKITEYFKTKTYTVPVDGGAITIDASNINSSKITVTGTDGLTPEEIEKAVDDHLNSKGLTRDGELTDVDGSYEVTIKALSETEVAQKDIENILTLKDQLNEPVPPIVVDVIDQASSKIGAINEGLGRALGLLNRLNNSSVNISVPGKFTGTANDITGSAFAEGSIGRLTAGAQLAQKTLVGELGPELAVYNGQYHLLGRNGAEFVKIPKDAIIFNHLQTAGILSGQMKDARGKPRTSGSAMATGNVKGPAAAGGISGALSQVKRARAVWQGLLDRLTAAELVGAGSGGGGGGGGSGNTIKAVVEELEEWYNLSRQIANIEQEINNIVAERENIADGSEYLRNLREEQKLLQQQETTQQTLLEYQKLQLRRQANQINQNRIWSQFLTVDESGLLQYVKGNETNGGKGALQVLQRLNEMSGQEQIDFLKNLGYSYTTNEGEALEGTELVEQFFQELQDQIDQYDALYDTVHETQQTLEELETSIEDINEEIKQNQMDLESAIYDIIVKAWETEIEQMRKQTDIIKEANDAYINGLNEALSSEQDLYSRNQDISDREQLQRQLSLLRRSGGSASQIADLEKQLDSALQDEYFTNQQEMIEGIQDASEEQVRKLQEQITIQEEALQYQKENGIIWTKVYEVMSGSAAEILSFMQGNSVDFFSQSLLQQEQMLTDWAKKIGIYTEDRVYNNYAAFAKTNIWDTGSAWQYGNLSNYRGLFNSLSSEDQVKLREQYASVYAGARMNGVGNEDAAKQAAENLYNTLRQRQQQQTATQAKAPTTTAAPAAPSAPSGGGGGSVAKKQTYKKVSLSVRAGDGHGSPSLSTTSASPGQTVTVRPNPNAGFKFSYLTYNGVRKTSTSITPSGGVASIAIVVYYTATGPRTVSSGFAKLQNKAKSYSKGGLVDYTGPALVHGTKSEPESFLNAEQTAQIREGLKLSGSSRILDNLRQTVGRLDSTIKNITTNNTATENNTFTVAPGAVTIQVAQLNDRYDVEELSNDIMNRMVSIASKSTNRGVSRR